MSSILENGLNLVYEVLSEINYTPLSDDDQGNLFLVMSVIGELAGALDGTATWKSAKKVVNEAIQICGKEKEINAELNT